MIVIDEEIPLIGNLCFGIVDRGTNLLQVRPIFACNLNCKYCAIDAGPKSKTRVRRFYVKLDHMKTWLNELIKFKEKDVEIHIDGTEPFMYDKILELIKFCKEFKNVNRISVQTNGTLLPSVKELEDAGLDRVNISLDTLNEEKGKELCNADGYSVKKVVEKIKELANSKIDLIIAPVYLPGINDKDIEEIIKFASGLKKEQKIPIMGIQMYEKHKLGRKIKLKYQSWHDFNKKLEEWEKKFNMKLKLSPEDFSTYKTKMYPIVFKKGEKAQISLKVPGSMKNQSIGIARNRNITVDGHAFKKEEDVKVKIYRTKHNIYLSSI